MARAPLLSLIAIAFGALPLAAVASGTAPIDLAALRAEVDTVASDLELERTAARDEIAALRSERAELERQVRAAQSRAKTLERVRAESVEQAEASEQNARRWSAPTAAALKVARDYVDQGIPFAQDERLALLGRLQKDLNATTPAYGRIIERLWRFIEEEESMATEVSMTQQRMQIDGEYQIVDVIRLGMALLYLRTQTGRYGWAIPSQSGWTIEMLEDPAVVQALEQRFDAHADNRALGIAELAIPTAAPGLVSPSGAPG